VTAERHAAEARPDRRGEIKMILAALLITAIGAGAIGFYFLLGMPVYSLYRLRAAVRDDDRDAFYRHFDARRVAESALARRVGARPAEVFVGPAERALRAAIDRKLGGEERASYAAMELESMERQGEQLHVRLRGASRQTTLVLEQLPDRLWTIVDIDLEAAGVDADLPLPSASRH
jgi:hypothetical protein